MDFPGKLGKIAALLQIPVAFEQRFALPLPKVFEPPAVSGVAPHQKNIVGHLRGQEHAASAFELLHHIGFQRVDKAFLHPIVPNTARVRGGFHLFRESVRAAHAADQIGVLILGEVGQLVKPDHVILRRLVPGHIPFILAVPELDDRPVRHAPAVVAAHKLSHSLWINLFADCDQRAFQFPDCPAHNQLPAARVPPGEHERVDELRIAFAAAGRAAEQSFGGFRPEEIALPRGNLKAKPFTHPRSSPEFPPFAAFFHAALRRRPSPP